MPLGIAVISWDEFQGGVISLRVPESLTIPDNIIQQLQVSHHFIPGFIHIKEFDFKAVSFGNEEIQKVIVLVLSKYEDGEDFEEIIRMVDEVLCRYPDTEDPQVLAEINRVFGLSHSVFKAREAVLKKLADAVADLKNRELQIQTLMRWLQSHETDPIKKILYVYLTEPILSILNFVQQTGLPEKVVLQTLDELIHQEVIEKIEEKYQLKLLF